MIIEIKPPVTREKVEHAIKLFSEGSNKKSIRKHFGKLKRNFDGLNYQKLIRNEWA